MFAVLLSKFTSIIYLHKGGPHMFEQDTGVYYFTALAGCFTYLQLSESNTQSILLLTFHRTQDLHT